MARSLVFLTLLLLGLPVFAQETIGPGHPDIDTSGFVADENNFVIHVKQGAMEQEFGSVRFSFSLDEEAGLLEGIRAYDMMGQKMADTLVVSWPSLAAVSHVSDNGQRVLRFSVADGMISGTRTTRGAAPVTFGMSSDGPFLDAAWMSIIASMLPLADGYTVTVRAFEDDESGLGDFALAVSGPAELVLHGGQKLSAWEVASTSPGGETVRYFLNATNRSLARVLMTPQPGIEVFIDLELEETK
ncbi:MAG: hypothetical protein R3284_07385 [Rubricoccaceae bacterium]|nr:hypothetical protein [Rubricoccaceae bacterium]